MSIQWTTSPKRGPPEGPRRPAGPGEAPGGLTDQELEESAAAVEELRRQLAGAPAEVVVANHCYGLFELAAVYLSQTPPLLSQAQLAIDALGLMVEGLGDRLGESQASLQEAVAQVRLAYVQLHAAEAARQEAGQDAGNGAAPTGG